MYAEDSDKSLDRILLTNQKLQTKKHNRDKVAARKRKPFRRNTTTKLDKDGLHSAIQEDDELSALAQKEVREALTDDEPPS